MRVVQYIQSFFSKGHERTLLAKKNIFTSLFLKGITVLMNMMLIPMTINYVNTTNYGIWLVLSSVVTWFNFFDIGFGNGLKNKLAQTNALKQYDDSRIYISSTYIILAIISLTIFSLFLIINHYINWNSVLNIQSHSVNNLNQLVILIFGFFCLQFISQLIDVVLTAAHATAKVSYIVFISQSIVFVVIFLLTRFTTGSLLYLVLAFAGIPIVIQIIASIWYYSTQYRQFAPSFKLVKLSKAKDLLGIGGYFFLLQIGALLLLQTDNIVITQLFGPKEVTTFNIAYKLFSVLSSICIIMITPFWSAFTDAYTKADFDWIKSTFKKMYKYWFILIGLCAVIFAISPFVYQLWLGGKVHVPLAVSGMMALYVIGFLSSLINCYFLNGIGKIKLQLYLYIICTITNIPLSIFLGKIMGVAGVTLSNVIVFIYLDIVLYIQCKKVMNQQATGIWNK